MYYAHSRGIGSDKEEWQELKEHLKNVSAKSGEFAQKFNHKNFGEIIGLFHDLGKYSNEFQKRLSGGRKVDHATAGAIELAARFNKPFGEKILAYCTIGHHSGLPDTGSVADSSSFFGRIKKTLPDYSAYATDWKNDEPELQHGFNLQIEQPEKMPFSLAFLTRMLFSCLVDADWLDTEIFMGGGKGRGEFLPLTRLPEKFNAYIAEFANPTTEINKKRSEILNECIAKAGADKGFYRLTVPTGGGKTLSSMAFALNHAVNNNQDRIIYTIPYTSIIEQNAQVFREIFGDENILEHHSNYIFEKAGETDISADETEKKLKFASENWDAPVIITTNVQFFESLFANKPSKCRKLHNIANSVIILDEAQMLPVDYLKPCMCALEELVKYYNCTVVLCTATQPALDGYTDIAPVEIISNPRELEKFFKRVEVENIGKRSDDELAEELSEQQKVLVIVNTKKHAKELCHRLQDEDGMYHLSSLMCPAHRKKKIAEIKERLAEHPDLPTRVISTQLIEAGVDIDFPCVYRSSAGLDSIIQSAGRCNRNGKLSHGAVKVFETTESYGKPKGYLQRTAQIGSSIIKDFDDPICAEAILKYFQQLYSIEETDKKNILQSFTMAEDGSENFEYKTVAQNFNLIEQNTKSIIVPYDDKAKNLIAKLKNSPFPKSCLKQLQPYTVNLYEKDYNVLQNKGVLCSINDIVDILADNNRYDEKEGLMIDNQSEALFV
jgi:CRISPR-associated helicase Cas3/CRISPR-associated endonuclease Cas3-HD